MHDDIVDWTVFEVIFYGRVQYVTAPASDPSIIPVEVAVGLANMVVCVAL